MLHFIIIVRAYEQSNINTVAQIEVQSVEAQAAQLGGPELRGETPDFEIPSARDAPCGKQQIANPLPGRVPAGFQAVHGRIRAHGAAI